MSIRAALVSLLDDDAGVGAECGDRIYHLVVPQRGAGASRMPALVYRLTATDRQKKYCGTDGTIGDQFVVDAYGVTDVQADDLANAVKALLIDYRGAVGDRFISDIALDNELDLMDDDPGRYRVQMTFSVWHRAA